MPDIDEVKPEKTQDVPAAEESHHGKEGLMVLVLVILILIVFLNSGFFGVTKVVVRGNRALAPAEVVLASGLNLHQNIFQIRCGQVQRRILRDFRIAKAEVQWRIPDQIIIQIKERRPLCLLSYRGNLLIIGQDGVIMGITDEDPGMDLPIITGLPIDDVKLGKNVSGEEFKVAMMILKTHNQELLPLLSSVDLRFFRLFLDLPDSPQTVKVELGNGDQLDKKLFNLIAILSNTNHEKLSTIDVRVPDLPTIITRDSPN